jgi:hypothetical protein
MTTLHRPGNQADPNDRVTPVPRPPIEDPPLNPPPTEPTPSEPGPDTVPEEPDALPIDARLRPRARVSWASVWQSAESATTWRAPGDPCPRSGSQRSASISSLPKTASGRAALRWRHWRCSVRHSELRSLAWLAAACALIALSVLACSDAGTRPPPIGAPTGPVVVSEAGARPGPGASGQSGMTGSEGAISSGGIFNSAESGAGAIELPGSGGATSNGSAGGPFGIGGSPSSSGGQF